MSEKKPKDKVSTLLDVKKVLTKDLGNKQTLLAIRVLKCPNPSLKMVLRTGYRSSRKLELIELIVNK